MTKKIIMGLALVSFLASLAGVIISTLLLKEDVTSTAHTVFEYFPLKFQVKPAETWEGAMILGYFTSVLQIVAASIMFSNYFSNRTRWSAAFAFVLSCFFDNWTDVVFRSGNLLGNIPVAIISTLSFYTVGSEVMSGFSWLVLFTFWRRAVSDLMWGLAMFNAGIRSIGSEWSRFVKAANTKEGRDRSGDPTSSSSAGSYMPKPPYGSNSSPQNKKAFTPFRPSQPEESARRQKEDGERRPPPSNVKNMSEIRSLMEFNSETEEQRLRR